jgi:amidohydrolase
VHLPTSGLYGAALQVQPWTVSLRRALHANPELGLQLPRTQRIVVDALESLGLRPGLSTSCSSVVVDLGAQDESVVLLRADMDALPLQEPTDSAYVSTTPGVMHACGHDLHTAMLLGVAKLLASGDVVTRKRVRLVFQPGEESAGGARHVIADGVLQNVESAFALHVTPDLPSSWIGTRPGLFMAAADTFSVRLLAAGSHPAAARYGGDPLAAAATLVNRLNNLPVESLEPTEVAVVRVTRLQSGSADNVVAGEALLKGTVRSLTKGTARKLLTALDEVVKAVATASGCAADVQIRRGYPVTRNDPQAVARMREAGTAALGRHRVVELPEPLMSSEDFSYYLEQVPGAMALLGAPPTPQLARHRGTLHTAALRLDESAMAAGTALLLALVEAELHVPS